jgi:hypothetical protein
MLPPLLYQLILNNAKKSAFAEYAGFAELAEFVLTDFLVQNLEFPQMQKKRHLQKLRNLPILSNILKKKLTLLLKIKKVNTTNIMPIRKNLLIPMTKKLKRPTRNNTTTVIMQFRISCNSAFSEGAENTEFAELAEFVETDFLVQNQHFPKM